MPLINLKEMAGGGGEVQQIDDIELIEPNGTFIFEAFGQNPLSFSGKIVRKLEASGRGN